MRQRGDGARLAAEALQRLRLTSHLGRQDFDGHLAPQAGVDGAIDLPHPAAADEIDDLVGAESGAGGKGHGRQYASSA